MSQRLLAVSHGAGATPPLMQWQFTMMEQLRGPKQLYAVCGSPPGLQRCSSGCASCAVLRTATIGSTTSAAEAPVGADPALQELAVGQSSMTIFTLVDFSPDRSLRLHMKPGWPTRTFGTIELTYAIRSLGASSSQLTAVMSMPPSGRFMADQRRWLLAWGDLPMMGKQLRVLTALAERTDRIP